MRYVCTMKRTTVMLSDETAARLHLESRRRGTSLAQVVREAVEVHLADPQEEPEMRRLSFFGISEGGIDDSEHVQERVREAIQRRSA